jgi:hypothetical protein
MDVSGAAGADEMQSAVALPKLKVPRRFKRAFGRLSQPPPPSKQLLAFAVSLILVAGGFALGRMSAGYPQDSPAMRIQGRPGLDIGSPGYVDYLGRVRGPAGVDLALMRISLRTAPIDSLGRFSSPFQPSTGREATRMVAHQESVAVVLTNGQGRSAVGAFPKARAPVLWLDGLDAAWESADALLVLEEGGVVRRWTFDEGGMGADIVAGSWLRIHQAPDGAVLESADADGHSLSSATADGLRRAVLVPEDGHALAVGPGGRRVLVEIDGRMNLWDGTQLTPMSLESGFEVHGASFSKDGDRVAAVVRERNEGSGKVRLVLFSASGTLVGIRPITSWTAEESCIAVPVWDRTQSWVFVAGNDGSLYAAETAGTRVVRSPPQLIDNVGCGITWSA